MRTADHMNLSRYIMDHMDAGASKLQKAAFIFGSVEPDINMLTYFRGSIRGEEKLRGHNYENVQKYMEKLTNKLTKKLEKGGMGTVRQSFLLGKLVHYVADSFTYPHNSLFFGNLKEHCQYETELHDYVNKTISSVGVNMESIDDGRDIVKYLREMHDRYVSEAPGCENDYRHITHAISVVTERFWQTESVSVPSMRDVAIACKKHIPVTANVSMAAAGNAGMESTGVA